MLVSDSQQPFDVLLSDIAMPGAMSGMELAEWVRQNRASMPVILMTGYAEELRRAKALSFTVLQKPVSAQALAATLARARRQDGKAGLPG
jgi:CheY-like chemotaxis protein